MALPAVPLPAEDEAPALLMLLDGLVRRDGEASGLRGEVCVGVRDGSGYWWWRARFGRRFSCGFVRQVSSTAHTIVCLGRGDAERLLATGHVPAQPELFTLHGDRGLFERFLARYTSRTGWVGIRLHR